MSGPVGDDPGGFRVVRLYHPSHHVPDLAEAEDWFQRVFGRPSTRLSTMSTREPPAGWSNDYATFTPIADVLFDCIDPARYLVDGRHLYEPVDRPRLKGLGWYVDGVGALYRSLRDHGLTVVDQFDRVAIGPEPPSAAGAPMPLFFTTPADAGLRHEFLPPIPFPLDHRLAEDWTPGAVSPDDPLGIVRCAHHTVRTVRPERSLRLLVDVLGGSVVHTGRDPLLAADVTVVHVADSLVQVAVPDDRSGLADHDDYGSIGWQVVDLDRAAAHLESHGVVIAARADHAVLTDPTTSLGIAWCFTDRALPGDPR